MPRDRRDDSDTTADGDDAGAARGGDLLLVIGGAGLRAVPFGGDTLIIGRSPECDVVVEHASLSRRHALVARAPAASVQDLGSTNGTVVAGVVHRGGAPVALRQGEAFHIGPFSFVISASRQASSTVNTGAERLVVDDPTADRARSLVREIAASEVSVLIQGETGVGKDVLASTLHALSGRPGPMMRINCAALSESLLEAELFGYEKGAFTGATGRKQGLLEAAAGGTVFLDEIGELPLAVQAKLLRAIEAREVLRLGGTQSVAIDARFVAATNRELAVEVAAGRFRSDLFFRLDGVTLVIPPLRDRRELIAPLALQFLREAAERLGRGTMSAAPEVLVALEAAAWPGNVRELKAVIDRAVLLARGREIGVRHLAFSRAASAAEPAVAADDAGVDYLTPSQRDERARVVAALAECVGNQTRAAKLLGMSRSTLVSKIALYRIPRPRS